MNSASPKSKSPRNDTKRQIDYYNVSGIYVYNIGKLANYAKKQDKVFYISATLFNFLTDLNYSVVRFLLEIMV